MGKGQNTSYNLTLYQIARQQLSPKRKHLQARTQSFLFFKYAIPISNIRKHCGKMLITSVFPFFSHNVFKILYTDL